jgi:adenylate cyclase
MNKQSFFIATLVLVALITYLFATAPPELGEVSDGVNQANFVAYQDALTIAEAESDVVRALWTKEIVGQGQKAGLSFDEQWRRPDVQAGPLPALFLREIAASIAKSQVRLNLFLGSDFPINEANLFDENQRQKFELVKEREAPQFFYSKDTQLYTAMFPDVAVVDTCVTCHNTHKESPKQDWKLGDIMGATTWLYPNQVLELDELMSVLTVLRQGFREAYSAYLAKVNTFPNPPVIGEKWPRDGYYLPSVELFMREVSQQTSPHTLEAILNTPRVSHKNETQ